jgi:hypothetical protein
MIFVNVCSTWRIVKLKKRFESWIKRNDINGESLCKLPYLITLMAYLCSQRTPKVQIKNFMFDWSIYRLFVLNRAWNRDCLQIIIFVCMHDVGHSWTKNVFWDVNNKKRRKWCKIVSPSLSKILMAYLCSQRTTNVQIKYFMYEWSIYSLFVLNTSGKSDSLQMTIFVNVCFTWGIVKLKKRFETWITRNDVNGVSWFHLSYLITLMGYLCSQRTPNVQIKYFMIV